ncbi:hypothetical protein STCU_07220 [Strigomonas culicis]|uniref:AB hydrolase-1 domain-containing protein n=1 Tax=Strigomonas culicis TaxID=28005 RepID=S9U6F2_9TRYP|nr:hypothetical protein STCU_07220 [Strigomonas culicis]|eukprot:EPY24359.1 hypothetical protein STCU_07220 [Strigomonas culicis]
MARDGLRLLDKLNIKKAHLLGTSMGGMIVQCMTLLAPARVLSLSILCSHHGGRGATACTVFTRPSFLDKPASESEGDQLAYQLRYAAWLTTDAYPVDTASYAEFCAIQRHRNPDDADAVLRQKWAIQRAASRVEGLRGLNTATQRNIPVTIIHGMRDDIIPVENGVQLAKTIAHSKLVLFANMGHTIPPALYDDVANEVGLHLLHSK